MTRLAPLIALLLAALPVPTFAAKDFHVAAAADLQFALPELVSAHVASGGQPPRLSFGSSGHFARQITQGAPYAVFLSADEDNVGRVIAAGRGDGPGRTYATGRLALYVPAGSPVRIDRNLADLAAAVGDGRLQRLALANPEHAPYGRAARAVMERQGLWPAVQGRLALGDNAAQAAQFAATGAAQAGLIPLSLARAPELAARGSYATLPEAWHGPLRQTLLVVTGAPPEARRFADFLLGAEAQAILRRHGFGPPG